MLNAAYLLNLVSPIDSQLISDTWALSSCCFHSTERHLNDEDINDMNLFIVSLDLENEGEQTSYFQGIRQELYSLSVLNSFKFCDLGNILPLKSIHERVFAFTELHNELLDSNKKLLIISNSDRMANLHYQVYEKRKININWVNIDSKINIFENPDSSQSGYLGKILQSSKHFIQNLAIIGTQEYYVQEEEKKILQQNLYSEIRLGKLKQNIDEIEPFLRSADIINYNLRAIENRGFQTRTENSPNGLNGIESCIVGGYVGASDAFKSLALYSYREKEDKYNERAALIAQIIWYLAKSYSLRIEESPGEEDLNFTRYIVNYQHTNISIAFYKSKITNRWWVEFKQSDQTKYVFPCTQRQYQMALNNDIPDEWIDYLRRIEKT